MPGFLAGSIFVTRKKKKEKPKRHAEVLKKLLKWGISLKSSKRKHRCRKPV
jgi:hypothetical protein